MLLLWTALLGVAPATTCDSEATGSMSCAAAGGGRVSAVIDNLYELRGLSGYACSALSHLGPERVTSFTCSYPTDVQVAMSQTECDVDVLVLDDTCSPSAGCVASNTAVYDATAGLSGTYTVSFVCDPGRTYFLIVEAKSRSGGTTCPNIWRDVDADGVQDLGEVGRGSRFRLERTCDEACADGGDNDRDALVDCADPDCSTHPSCCDLDGDTFLAASCGGDDCDDAAASIRPGATDAPADGVDQDCDGVDTCYQDADLDGVGAAIVPGPGSGCMAAGYATVGGDCDDAAPSIFPGATELVADGVDQDCDGADRCYVDADDDNYGTTTTFASPTLDCLTGPGAAVPGDCDDADPDARPTAVDPFGDGVDQDCDGTDGCAGADCNPADPPPVAVPVLPPLALALLAVGLGAAGVRGSRRDDGPPRRHPHATVIADDPPGRRHLRVAEQTASPGANPRGAENILRLVERLSSKRSRLRRPPAPRRTMQ